MESLEALLQQLMSPDNTIRSEAEKVFEQAKNDNAQNLVNALLHVLANAQQDEMRLMSAILLRKILVRDEHTIWENLSSEVKFATKHALLSSLTVEQPKNRRRKVCDIIAEIATKQGESPAQLVPQLLEWGGGESEHLRLSALMILAQLCKETGNDLAPFVPQSLSIIQQNLSLQNPELLSIRIAALDVFGSIHSIGEGGGEGVNGNDVAWQALVPSALQFIGEILNLGKEQEAKTALQIMISIAEVDARGRLLKPHLPALTQAMLTIAAHTQLDDDLRNLALEFLLTLISNSPAACRKIANLPETMFSIAIQHMLEVDDDVGEWNAEDPADEDNISENFLFGEEALDRMALSFRWKSLRNACHSLLQQFVASQDWKHRHAAVMAVSQVGEVIPQDELDPFVQVLLRSFSDPHPRVRWAAINAIGQLSSDFGPYLQDNFHNEIVPRLVASLGDSANPRVQAHAASAVINFAEHLSEEVLEPHLDTLLIALQGSLQSPNPHVVSHSLPAIASIADVAEEQFTKYYDSFMPYLKAILMAAHQQNNEMLCVKAIECITLVGVSVGKEKFYNDAKGIIDVMVHIEQNTETEPGDPQHSYMLSAWTRVCKCMGEDFLPYLPTVLPPLLETVQLDDVINVESDSDDDEPEQVVVNTGLLDDKATAVNMLYVYACELKGGFFPYVQQVLESLLPCLTFVYMSEIRGTAAICMPELVRCVDDHVKRTNSNDRTPVLQIFSVAFEALLHAIQQELMLSRLSRAGPEQDDAMAQLVEGLHECIEVVGKNVLTEEHVKTLCGLIQALVADYDEKHVLREKTKLTEDFDDDVEEQHGDEYERDDESLTELSLLFGNMIKNADPLVVMAHFEATLQETFLQKLDPKQSSNSRKMAMFLFDDIIQFGNGASKSYFTPLIQAMIAYCNDSDAGVRQAATFGVGVCAEKGGEQFAPFLTNACTALMQVISKEKSREEENAAATDNAASALAKIMIAFPVTIPQLVGHFVEYLPLQQDLEEGYTANANLLDLMAREPLAVLGQQFERVGKIVEIFAEILDPENDMLKEDQVPQFKSFLSQLASQQPEKFQAALQALSDDQKQHFQ